MEGDAHIVHAIRVELIWFVNILLTHFGVVVRPLSPFSFGR